MDPKMFLDFNEEFRRSFKISNYSAKKPNEYIIFAAARHLFVEYSIREHESVYDLSIF